MEFGFGLFGAWWFSLIYIVFSYGLWFIFPRYIQIRFNKIPYIKYVSEGYKFSYLLLLLSTTYVLFDINTGFYLGIILYISGLTLFISAIFYFSINEIELVVSSGVYKYSRHPVYFGFFVMWFGVSVITFNFIILLLTITYGFFSYKIAIKEEESCIGQYGKEYKFYQNKVNFVLGRK